MSMTDRINARIDPALKLSVEGIFSRLGLSAGEAIRLFYSQVEMRQGLPFDVRIPNTETLAAMEDAKQGRNLRRYKNAAAMFADWEQDS